MVGCSTRFSSSAKTPRRSLVHRRRVRAAPACRRRSRRSGSAARCAGPGRRGAAAGEARRTRRRNGRWPGSVSIPVCERRRALARSSPSAPRGRSEIAANVIAMFVKSSRLLARRPGRRSAPRRPSAGKKRREAGRGLVEGLGDRARLLEQRVAAPRSPGSARRRGRRRRRRSRRGSARTAFSRRAVEGVADLVELGLLMEAAVSAAVVRGDLARSRGSLVVGGAGSSSSSVPSKV